MSFVDVFDHSRKLGTMSVISRTRIICTKYKKCAEKDIANYIPVY